MNSDQINYLENQYQQGVNWGTNQITFISQRLRLDRTKVYKWLWDRRRKDTQNQPMTQQATTEEEDVPSPNPTIR